MNTKKLISRSIIALLLPMILLLTSCSSGGSSGSVNGSLSSTDISVNIAINETITAFGEKVYRFETNTAGNYTISLTNLASDLGWTLYSYDPDDTSLIDLFDNIIDDLNGDVFFDTTDEEFTLLLNSNTYYYLVVDEWDDVPSSYTLQIIQ